MRPGQNNKRLRGRNNNHGRKGPNPLTRSFESNGPDVKIRGTAQHIAEKYLQLARDAQTSGDPVMAENYLQHAEHYYRVIAAAHQAQQQAMGFVPKPAQESEDEDDGVEEDDRFASVADRLPQPPQPVQQPGQPVYQGHPQNPGTSAYPGQPQGGQQPYQGQPGGGGQYGERQPYQGNNQRPWRDNNRQDNRQDYQSRGGDNRGEARFEGGERQDRPFGQAGGQPNPNQNWRNENRRRDPRPEAVEQDQGGGLPAFITGGARPATETAPATPAPESELGGQDNTEGGYHLRPRRRRRGRPSANADQFGEGNEPVPQDDPVPASE